MAWVHGHIYTNANKFAKKKVNSGRKQTFKEGVGGHLAVNVLKALIIKEG